MTSVQSDVREAKQFIGGEWSEASEGATFDDRDPFTGDVVASVPGWSDGMICPIGAYATAAA